MEHIYEIFGNLLAALVVGLLAALVPKARAWFEANADRAIQERVQRLIRAFAQAAEQLYRNNDPQGDIRKRFVQEQLRALGIEITEAVINMIESAVWEINTTSKQSQVQVKEITSCGSYNPDEAYREFRRTVGIGGSDGNG